MLNVPDGFYLETAKTGILDTWRAPTRTFYSGCKPSPIPLFTAKFLTHRYADSESVNLWLPNHKEEYYFKESQIIFLPEPKRRGLLHRSRTNSVEPFAWNPEGLKNPEISHRSPKLRRARILVQFCHLVIWTLTATSLDLTHWTNGHTTWNLQLSWRKLLTF